MKSSASKYRYIVPAYKGLALLLLNTLVLAIVLAFILDSFYSEKNAPKLIYSKAFKLESYSLIDRQIAIETGREFDIMGERESYQFYPWTVFIERPFDGKYLSVSQKNIRKTKSATFSELKKKELEIWCFGGSTMFGWGMPDSQTIPSHLQEILQRELPAFRVQVTNHGHAYWFSSMELAYFSALLRESSKPDIAIFLDGLNDGMRLTNGQFSPFFSHIAAQAWEQERQMRYSNNTLPWFTVNESFPILRFVREIGKVFGLRDTSYRPKDAVFNNPKKRHVSFEVSLRHFDTNRAVIRSIGQALGIEVFHFLQPIPGYGNYKVDTVDMDEKVYRFYDRLLEKPAEGFYPIHDVLADLEAPFVDKAHYSDAGCRRMAESIAAVIVSQRYSR